MSGEKCEAGCQCLRHKKTGKKCEPGCKCSKHGGKPYCGTPRKGGSRNDIRRGTCWVPRDDDPSKPCGQGLRNVTLGVCSMHYGRWERHGSYDRLPPHKRGQSANPRTAEFRQRRAKSRLTLLLEGDGGNNPCMCGCKRVEHDRINLKESGHCMVFGCPCTKYDAANKQLHNSIAAKIERLGFSNHIHEHATCNKCLERIMIGTWFNAFTIRRAANHVGRSCTYLHSKNMTKAKTGTVRSGIIGG